MRSIIEERAAKKRYENVQNRAYKVGKDGGFYYAYYKLSSGKIIYVCSDYIGSMRIFNPNTNSWDVFGEYTEYYKEYYEFVNGNLPTPYRIYINNCMADRTGIFSGFNFIPYKSSNFEPVHNPFEPQFANPNYYYESNDKINYKPFQINGHNTEGLTKYDQMPESNKQYTEHILLDLDFKWTYEEGLDTDAIENACGIVHEYEQAQKISIDAGDMNPENIVRLLLPEPEYIDENTPNVPISKTVVDRFVSGAMMTKLICIKAMIEKITKFINLGIDNARKFEKFIEPLRHAYNKLKRSITGLGFFSFSLPISISGCSYIIS